MDRAKSAGAAAAGVTVLLWASAFVGIRAAAEHLSAGPLTLGRLVVGAAALGAFVAVRRDQLPPRSALPRLLACGLLWFGAYNVLLNAAEQRIDAGTAAMLVNVGPVILAVLAGVMLHEGFPRSLRHGLRDRVRGRDRDRAGDVGAQRRRRLGRRAVRGGGGRVRRRRGRPEAAAGVHARRSR